MKIGAAHPRMVHASDGAQTLYAPNEHALTAMYVGAPISGRRLFVKVPFACNLVGVYASISTKVSTGTLTVQAKYGTAFASLSNYGTAMSLTTSVDADSKTPGAQALVAGAYIVADIGGTFTVGADLGVTFVVERTA